MDKARQAPAARKAERRPGARLRWLEAEIKVVRPGLIVLLGATAAQAVMGPAFRVSRQRGEVLASPLGVPVLATVHPSSILRAADEESRDVAMASLVSDLRVAAEHA